MSHFAGYCSFFVPLLGEIVRFSSSADSAVGRCSLMCLRCYIDDEHLVYFRSTHTKLCGLMYFL